MDLLEGALALSLKMVMYGMRFVLAVLVFWLILGSLQEKRPAPPQDPGKRVASKERLA